MKYILIAAYIFMCFCVGVKLSSNVITRDIVELTNKIDTQLQTTRAELKDYPFDDAPFKRGYFIGYHIGKSECFEYCKTIINE